MASKNRTSQRTFLETHPWLTFQLDLSKTGYALWMNLGAAQSQCEQVAQAMLPPDVAQEW